MNCLGDAIITMFIKYIIIYVSKSIVYQYNTIQYNNIIPNRVLQYEYWCCLQVLYWRTVPTKNSGIGEVARGSEPFMRQVFVVQDVEMEEEEFKRQVS